MTWLTSLPAAVLVIGGLVLALLVAIGGRLAVQALIPAAEREGAHTIAAPLMPALGAIFALLMGLTLASEAGFLASAQGIVSSEAADASRLAWAATSPGVDSEPIQSTLLAYLKATRTHEWNGSNAANGDDPATTHAIASLETAVRTQAARPTLGTPTSTELLASLDALTSDRRARLAAASRQLPALYVAVLLLTGVALIVNAAALTLRSGRRGAVLVGGLAAVIGLSLALLFALGTPWRGPISVSGQPIDAVVHDLNIGYFHPLPPPTRGPGLPSRSTSPSHTTALPRGARQPSFTTMRVCVSEADRRGPLQPLGTLPPSGSMHRWFPAVITGPPINVSKRPSSCKYLVGATRFEPVTPSLVSKVCNVAGGCWKWPNVASSCGDHGW